MRRCKFECRSAHPLSCQKKPTSMMTRSAQSTRAQAIMSGWNEDIWIKILNHLKVNDGKQLLLVNKYLSNLFSRQNRKKIIQRMLRNIYWFNGYINGFEECDVSINIPSRYVCIFFRIINEQSYLMGDFSESIAGRLYKELSMYSFPEIFSGHRQININVFWPIHEATKNGKDVLFNFRRCKKHLKKCDGVLIESVRKLFCDVKDIECINIETWIDTRKRSVILKSWSTKRQIIRHRSDNQI